MKYLVGLLILASSLQAFATGVSIETGNKTVFYDISGAALTEKGIEIRVNGKPACYVLSNLMLANNISGLDMLAFLDNSGADYWAVECKEINGQISAFKIRPRMEP